MNLVHWLGGVQDGKVNDRVCDRKCKSLQEWYCLWMHIVCLSFQLLIDLVKCKTIRSMKKSVIGSARMVLFVEYTLYAYFLSIASLNWNTLLECLRYCGATAQQQAANTRQQMVKCSLHKAMIRTQKDLVAKIQAASQCQGRVKKFQIRKTAEIIETLFC